MTLIPIEINDTDHTAIEVEVVDGEVNIWRVTEIDGEAGTRTLIGFPACMAAAIGAAVIAAGVVG